MGYSGKLAGRPQTHFLARVALMINPGHTKHSILASERVWEADAVPDTPPTCLEGAIYLLSLFKEQK